MTVVLFLMAAAVALSAPDSQPQYYRIEVAPSGSFVAIGAPIDKGYALVFRAYPDGKVMSIRKTELRKVSPITAQEAATPAKKDVIPIANLPMQGASGAPGAPGAGAGNAARPGVAPPPSASHVNVPAVVPVEGGLAISTAPRN